MTPPDRTQSDLESWKPVDIPGFEPCYSVSDLGRARSERGGSLLRPGLNKLGYPQLCFSVNGSRWHGLLAPLVAGAFLGPRPTTAHVVAHRDRCRANCRASNLSWATCREIAASTHPPRKLAAGRRPEVIALRGTVSAREAARIYGLSVRRIQQIWKGGRAAEDDGSPIE